MNRTKIPSPARSDSAIRRKRKTRNTRSIGSPTCSNASDRLSSIIDQFKEANRESFAPSPLNKTVLTDNTEIEQPRRQSWWKKVNHSRNISEVLEVEKPMDFDNIMEDLELEALSQEKKKYSLDLPESSGSESIGSIVLPQRKLFTQKENVPHDIFKQIVVSRKSMTKQNKTNLEDEAVNIGTKTLFGRGEKRSRPAFPDALLNFSPEKTITNQSKNPLTDVKTQPRSLFGHKQGTKRKNIYAEFVVSESEEEISEIQPKLFAFQRNTNPVRHSTASRLSRGNREPSPASSLTTDIEMDDWKMLPSSTMVEHQLDALAASTPEKKARLSKLSEAKESDVGANSNNTTNKTKLSNKSTSKNKSKTTPDGTAKEPELDNSTALKANKSKSIENIDKIATTNKEKTSPINKSKSNSVHEEMIDVNGTTNKINNQTQVLNKTGNKNLPVIDEKIREVTDIQSESNSRVIANQTYKINNDTAKADVVQDNDNEKNITCKSQLVNEVQIENKEDLQPNDVVVQEETVEEVQVAAEEEEQVENEEVLQVEDIKEDALVEDDEEELQIKDKKEVQIEVEDEQVEDSEKDSLVDDDQDELRAEDEKELEAEEGKLQVEAEKMQTEDEEVQVEDDEVHVEEEEETQVEDDEVHVEEEEEIQVEDDEEVDVEDDEVQDQNEMVEESEEEEELRYESEVENEEVDQNEDEEDVYVDVEQDIEENVQAEVQESEQEETDEINVAPEKENKQTEVQVSDQEETGEINAAHEAETATPNVTHDTAGTHHQNDAQSPEDILHNISNQDVSFIAKGRNTSIRKTLLKDFTVRQIEAPLTESTGLDDGTKNSSAEGSGWDSHRTTRKTLRQTFGKDFTPRKSLRALVMEKSAKRQTAINEANAKLHQANSTEIPNNNAPEFDAEFDNDEMTEEYDHEISKRTRQTTLEKYLQKVKNDIIETKRKIEAEVRDSKTNPVKLEFLNRAPHKGFRKTSIKLTAPKAPKPKRTKVNIVPLEQLPEDFINDLNYRPPQRYRPRNASWLTKRLYKFLESKLEPKYDYKARLRAEKLAETLYEFTRQARKQRVAPPHAVAELKHELARLAVVNTHYEFYDFIREYMPFEVKIKVVPDIVNNIPLPTDGLFSNIIS